MRLRRCGETYGGAFSAYVGIVLFFLRPDLRRPWRQSPQTGMIRFMQANHSSHAFHTFQSRKSALHSVSSQRPVKVAWLVSGDPTGLVWKWALTPRSINHDGITSTCQNYGLLNDLVWKSKPETSFMRTD